MIDRLATYGTLGPGRPNHHVLQPLSGTWTTGTVRGHLVDRGWGAALGYPALILDPRGPAVRVDLLASAELGDHWDRLDDFEGVGYRRMTTEVTTSDGNVDAQIYVAAHA